ncbi:septum site-determining protein MinC [Companilactobacillus baiquanensis]|uniref:Probable septum site-determining protein MinC n=1 Tax=Companilactobacillus baiquanensis TaxID=2486005 RepID=A0ABW1UWS2_9LACO|nr:septum site-determining protein MinC [Companilactobacillus baiquanensis]
MSNVTLKGSKDGYVMTINDQGDFSNSLKELKKLIANQNVGSSEEEVIQFTIKTGNRLLTDDQIKKLKTSFSEYPQIEIKSIDSDVEDKSVIEKLIKASQINVEAGIVRSGQKLEYDGDLLFLGTLHDGAHISATGSIFIIGDVHGIVQAGYPDNTGAAICGNLSGAAQFRIADVIEIVTEDNSEKFKNNSFAYLDDLHTINVEDMQNYREIINDSRKRTV